MGHKKKNSYIKPNEILEDSIYLDDVEFLRYYHKGKPTRYFAYRDGRIYS